jgi:hypothetical protein
MKNWDSRKAVGLALIGASLIIMASVAVAMKGVQETTGVLRPAVIFTVNPGQTARISVVGPTQGNWTPGRTRSMLLGFDVYHATGTIPRSLTDSSCVKYHMIERQACQVDLAPGEAASFDFAVPSEGAATQISPVFLVDGNDAGGALRSTDLMPTLELRDGGRTTGLVVLPAVQQGVELTERRLP